MNTASFNFDGATVATLPTAFVNVGAASYAVQTAGAVSGANALGIATSPNNAGLIYTGQANQADACLQFDQVVNLDGTGSGYNVGGVLRANAGFTQAYLFLLEFDGSGNCSVLIYSGVGGTNITGGGSVPTGLAFANGDTLHFKCQAQGSTIAWKVWKNSASEPGSSSSITDATYSAAGFAGFLGGGSAGSGVNNAPAVDNVYIGNAGSTFSGGFVAPTLSAGAVGSGTAALDWTAAGQAGGTVAYQLQQSAHGAGSWSNVSGATSSPATASGLTNGTPYDFRVQAADGVNAPVYSGTVTQTPTAANATGYTLSASPGSVAVGTPSTITAGLTGGSALSSTLVITLADSLGSTISGTISIANGSTTGTATVDPSAAGTHDITASHAGGGFSGGDGSTSFTATASGTFAANLTTLYPSPTAQVELILTGSGTSWSSGTAFTLSGGAGASIASQANASSTKQVLKVVPGTATGNLTIADPTTSATIAVAVAAGSIAQPNNAGLRFQGKTIVGAQEAVSITTGIAGRLSFSGDSARLRFNAGATAALPDLFTQVDRDPIVRSPITAAVPAVTIAPAYTTTTTAKAYQHNLRFWWATYEGAGDPTYGAVEKWATQQSAARFAGADLPGSGALLTLPPANPNVLWCVGDSLTETVRTLYAGSGASNQTVELPTAGWPQQLADALGCDLLQEGYGGQGVTVAGSGSVPAAPSAIGHAYSGAAYTPPNLPAIAILYHASNDAAASSGAFQTAYLATVAAIRAASPSCLVFAVNPHPCNGTTHPSRASDIAAAVSGLSNVFVGDAAANAGINPANDWADTLGHLNPGGHDRLALFMAGLVQAELDTLGVKLQGAGSGGLDAAQVQAACALAIAATPGIVGTNNDKSGYALSASGADPIEIEPGVNLRQALSPILAFASGAITGNGTGTVLVKAPGTGTTRVTATMGTDDRIATVLNLPT